ncbi:hypothetical protein H2203_002261 [Taxawa tesnikishii (nom. ined.)]|nr:hypothetical protein H2203_002261 [Dothideales sp. JES 119]
MINSAKSRFTRAVREWSTDRKFDPFVEYLLPSDTDLSTAISSIESPNPIKSITHLGCDKLCSCCGRRMVRISSLVVAVDGACRRNGAGVSARAAIGVFFHAYSSLNIAATLPAEASTNQRAELTAGLRALQMVYAQRKNNSLQYLFEPPARARGQLVIESDSRYLVQGMTEWIVKWKQNGYRNARGISVTNADLFKALEKAVRQLNSLGVEVLFWHVPRSLNQEADLLANFALNAWEEIESKINLGSYTYEFSAWAVVNEAWDSGRPARPSRFRIRTT